MKKIVLTALICTLVLAALAGCAKKEENIPQPEKEIQAEIPVEEYTLVGSWKYTMNVGEIMASSYNSNEDEAVIAPFVDLSNLTLDMSIAFDENGNYTAVYDEEKLSAMAEEVAARFEKGYMNYVTKSISEQKLDTTVDEQMQNYVDRHGRTLREAAHKNAERVIRESGPQETGANGFYELDGDKLYMWKSDGQKVDGTYKKVFLSTDRFDILESYIEGEKQENAALPTTVFRSEN